MSESAPTHHANPPSVPDPACATASRGIEPVPASMISVLIVGYRCREFLADCLEGLLSNTCDVSMEVLYVDCSGDGSAAMVRERFPTVRVLENEENLGFARGNNTLAKHAKGEYLLLLNPDTLIRDNAVGEVLAFAEAHPEGGAWGGITWLADGGIDPSCQQASPGLRSLLGSLLGVRRWSRGGLREGDKQPAEVPTLTGAFMLVRRSLWERLGGFDESFFMYSEEVDLCYRIRRAGYRVLMTPAAAIVHLVGGGSRLSPERLLAMTRGAVHFNRKHFGPVRVWLDIALRWLHSLSRWLLGVVGRPLVGKERAAALRRRHRPIVTSPGQWVRGWSS